MMRRIVRALAARRRAVRQCARFAWNARFMRSEEYCEVIVFTLVAVEDGCCI